MPAAPKRATPGDDGATTARQVFHTARYERSSGPGRSWDKLGLTIDQIRRRLTTAAGDIIDTDLFTKKSGA